LKFSPYAAWRMGIDSPYGGAVPSLSSIPSSFGMPGVGTSPFGGPLLQLKVGDITSSSPSGGIFSDPTVCGLLKQFGLECNLQGAAQAAARGIISLFRDDEPQGDACPGGMVKFGERCLDPSAVLPGGDPFITGAGGTAVMGAFGMPAMQPMIVGSVMKDDGTTSPVRRCMAGMVLGKDDLCYPKAALNRKYRKWAPDRKPPVSAADAQAIRQAESAKKRVKKLAGDVGFTCKKR